MGHAYKSDDLLKTTKAISSTYFLNKVHDYVVMYTKKISTEICEFHTTKNKTLKVAH